MSSIVVPFSMHLKSLPCMAFPICSCHTDWLHEDNISTRWPK
jgi:hypothetical protein